MPSSFSIVPAQSKHRVRWLEMRLELWPECEESESDAEILEILSDPEQMAFVAIASNRRTIGFIEVGLRPWVDGCSSSPVGYVEGIFVKESCRQRGVASELLAAGMAWARSKGCREMGSDADIENQASIDFHKQVGFTEIERQVVFLRML